MRIIYTDLSTVTILYDYFLNILYLVVTFFKVFTLYSYCTKEFHEFPVFRGGREIYVCCTTDIEIRGCEGECGTSETGQELNKNESTVRVLCGRISIDFVPVNAGIPIPARGVAIIATGLDIQTAKRSFYF